MRHVVDCSAVTVWMWVVKVHCGGSQYRGAESRTVENQLFQSFKVKLGLAHRRHPVNTKRNRTNRKQTETIDRTSCCNHRLWRHQTKRLECANIFSISSFSAFSLHRVYIESTSSLPKLPLGLKSGFFSSIRQVNGSQWLENSNINWNIKNRSNVLNEQTHKL